MMAQRKMRFWNWIVHDIAKITEGTVLPGWATLLYAMLFPWERLKWKIKVSCGYQPQTDTWLIHGREYSSNFFLGIHPGKSFTVTKSQNGLMQIAEINLTTPEVKLHANWCPDRCPVTMRPFFMWIEHPDLGMVPTYGGPFDSFTIPTPDNFPERGAKVEWFDLEFSCARYDHDLGGWVGYEDPGIRVITEQKLIELNAWPEDEQPPTEEQ
jgi:hypothetical protein